MKIVLPLRPSAKFEDSCDHVGLINGGSWLVVCSK